MKTMRVKILRPFYFNREVQKLGAVSELPAVFAVEMIAANKAERIEEAEAVAPAAATEKPEAKKKIEKA